jgi:ABC-type Fe3+/spermidine/putrescine transport system ATPase subunit
MIPAFGGADPVTQSTVRTRRDAQRAPSGGGHLRIAGLSRDYGGGEGLAPTTLTIPAGDLTVLLGPSGSGKSTLLRLLSGFEVPDSGTVLLDGVSITEDPPERRPTAMVFQSHALWPHLTVAQQVGYGLRVRRWARARTAARVDELLALVRLEGLGDRYPRQLSGGQRQRVALARAMAIEPRILLLDEPLSALDARLRDELRAELRGLQARLGITMVYVTHDQQDALALADQVVVLDRGHVQQTGTPEDVHERPANRFVASFCGDAVLVPCQEAGPQAVTTPAGVLYVAGGAATPTHVAIRRAAIELAPEPGPDTLRGRVVSARYHGGPVLVRVDVAGTSIDIVAPLPGPGAGDAVELRFPRERLWRVADTLSVR